MWFAAIGAYVMVLGGIFYYNLFKWTFDEKLKLDIQELVKTRIPEFKIGLLQNRDVITIPEMDIMQLLSKEERVASVLYLNGNGTIRWHKDSRYLGTAFDEFVKTGAVPTKAIEDAYFSKTVKFRQVPNQPIYDIAIPVVVSGTDVIGVLDVQVSRVLTDDIIRSAMTKYLAGSLGVLLLIGIPLYIFLYYYVLGPLRHLRDSVDAVSTKTLELRYPVKRDEIGGVAEAVGGLLLKVKSDFDSIGVRDQAKEHFEHQWWHAIISAAVPRSSRAIVVDEDNTVLHANFDVPVKNPGQKPHLLDIIDTQQQDILRLIGSAMDSPQKIIEGETVFQQESWFLRVIQLHESGGSLKRTLIILIPKLKAVVGGA